MFAFSKQIEGRSAGEGMSRKVLGNGGSMMMVEVTFLKGAQGAPHRHIHEQVSYIAAGSFEFSIEGEAHVVRQGDGIYIPANAEHSCRALEDSVIVDVFTPQREDFL
jgi:quercetin dioxygenase-like cupin family protein